MPFETLKLTAQQKKKYFHLPIEQAVFVPTTSNVNKRVSHKEVHARVNEVEKKLAGWFGGFTSVRAQGGYQTNTKKGFVEEPVIQVVSFSTDSSYRKNKAELLRQIPKWGRRWGQKDMGYQYETDLYYIPSAKKPKRR